jgi:hypothetical protein
MRPVRRIVAVVAMVIIAGVFRRATITVHLGARGMTIAMILGGRTRRRMRMLASGARMWIRMRTLGTGTSV